MNRKFAASLLSVLLYAQGLLGFAGLAAVLIERGTVERGKPPVVERAGEVVAIVPAAVAHAGPA